MCEIWTLGLPTSWERLATDMTIVFLSQLVFSPVWAQRIELAGWEWLMELLELLFEFVKFLGIIIIMMESCYYTLSHDNVVEPCTACLLPDAMACIGSPNWGKTEVNFTSEIRGEGRFPSGENLGSGIMTKYPPGIIYAPPAKVQWWLSRMAPQFMRLAHGGKIKAWPHSS